MADITTAATTNMTKTHVIIIGAGVIGLQSALTLLEAGHDVTILAKHHPGDSSIEYTSPWAGAMWRTHATADEKREQGWDMTTFEYWTRLVDREVQLQTPLSERSGIVRCSLSNIYTSEHHPDLQPTTDPSTSLWFANKVPDFASITPPSSPPGLRRAWRHSAFTVDVPKYLAYLRARVEDLGGIFAPRVSIPGVDETGSLSVTLAHAFAIASETRIDGERGASVFVNATGLGAKQFVADQHMFPVRGQVLLVNGVAKEASAWHRDQEGHDLSYVIPRPDAGVTIIGGCKEKGRSEAGLDDWRTKEILEKCKLIAPELLNAKGEFEVLGSQVGLRPARQGGAKVEREQVGDRWLVHAYGHSGAGYQNSVGVAADVLRLVQQCSGGRRTMAHL